MSATFTDDDVDKTVENANGEVIGTVTEVEDDTARVEPRAGLVDSIRAALGWNETHEETLEVHKDSVDEISSEAIRLESESMADLDDDHSTSWSAGADDTESPEANDQESTEPASTPERDGATAAERDPGTELAGEMEQSGRRGTAEESGEPATRNAADRSEEPDETVPIEEMDQPALDERDAAGATEQLEETAAPDEPNPDDPTDEFKDPEEIPTTGLEGENGGHDSSDGLDETDGGNEVATSDESADWSEPKSSDEPAESDEQPSPEATSATRSVESSSEMGLADSPGETDRVGVEDAPVDETPEPIDEGELIDDTASDEDSDADAIDGADAGPSTERAADIESANDATDTAETEPETAETDPADAMDPGDELDPGVDLDSAADIDGSNGTDDEVDGPSETADVADEVDPGVDLEAAADPDETDDFASTDGSSEADEIDPADEFDPGVDLESAWDSDAAGSETEPDPADDGRPETELDSDVGDYASSETDPRPETDLESAAYAADDASAESAVGDASAIDESEAASEIVPGVDIESAVEPDDRPTEGRDRVRSRSGTPLAAVLAAQRATLTSGQELVKQGLAAQQRTARSAVELPLLAQRQGIETAQSATRRYFDAVTALTSAERTDSRERQSFAEAIDELEAAHTQLTDEEFSRQLADHLDELRSLREQYGDEIERGNEQVLELLERQADLIERCRNSIETDHGQTER